MNFKQKIEELYRQSQSANYTLNTNCLYTILQLKIHNPDLQDYYCTFYKDIKMFVNNYILAIELEEYGYDVISIEKILRVINKLDSFEKKSKILQFLYLKLKKYNFDDECHVVQQEQKKILIKSLINSYSIFPILRGLLYCLFYNFWIILIISGLLLVSYYVMTLPLIDANEAWFVLEGREYTDSLYSNHLLNIIIGVFGLEDSTYCQPNSVAGIITLVLYKIIGTTVISGALMKYVGKYLLLKVLEYED